MSTSRAALLVLLVGCSSNKSGDVPAPAGPCLPRAALEAGTGTGTVEGVEATVCFSISCLRLDRNGKPISAAAEVPPYVLQVQQDRQVGGNRVVVHDPAGQWSLKNTETDEVVRVGAPGDRLDIVETAVVAYHADKLQLADPVALRVVGMFTLPGRIAAVMPWFDRIFVVLDRPAGTAQIDPATATVYTGPPLHACP